LGKCPVRNLDGGISTDAVIVAGSSEIKTEHPTIMVATANQVSSAPCPSD
jgi:hypothetical protein